MFCCWLGGRESGFAMPHSKHFWVRCHHPQWCQNPQTTKDHKEVTGCSDPSRTKGLRCSRSCFQRKCLAALPRRGNPRRREKWNCVKIDHRVSLWLKAGRQKRQWARFRKRKKKTCHSTGNVGLKWKAREALNTAGQDLGGGRSEELLRQREEQDK